MQRIYLEQISEKKKKRNKMKVDCSDEEEKLLAPTFQCFDF